MSTRVGQRLNAALHRLFADDPLAVLLGEDVIDPYGGAFKITAGLSTAYPDRVLTTPLSENGMVGVANGLALRGDTAIVELMFGDFLLLALDQLVNFAAKAVAMYGRPVPMRLLVRVPVGGHRGYGATHSQAVQRFLQGVPDLALWELNPFVEPHEVITRALAGGRPAVLFEDKVLYTRRMITADDPGRWRVRDFGSAGLWTAVGPQAHGDREPQVVLLAAGGPAYACLDALDLLDADGVPAVLVSPARLQPLDLEPVLPIIAACGAAVVVEEAGGGSWGSDLALALHDRLWHRLRAPVAVATSLPTPVPAATHLERAVLVGADDIAAAARGVHARAGAGRPLAAATAAAPTAAAPTPGSPPAVDATVEVLLPVLNPNDDVAELTSWLAGDGATVRAGELIATVETSKASADVESPAAGTLLHAVSAGAEYPVRSVIARVVPAGSAPPAVADPAVPDPAVTDPAVPTAPRRRTAQHAVAATVTESHRTIPAAFVASEAGLGPVTAALARVAERTGAPVGLDVFCIAALCSLRADYPQFFTPVGPDGEPGEASSPDVAVTVDVDTGLFMPVLRDPAGRCLDDLADDLTALQMTALTGRFPATDLTGAGAGVSLNLVEGVTVVAPIILPTHACIVAFGGIRVRPGHPDGDLLTLSVSYDHRVVNGRPAALFVRALAAVFADPEPICGG